MSKKIVKFVVGATVLMLVVVCYCLQTHNGQVKIVLSLPLSGSGAQTGENARRAYDLCASKWNASGGLLGKQVVLEAYDNKADSKAGPMIANLCLLKGEKPLAIMEGVTGVFLSSQAIYEKHKVIHVCIAASEKIFDSNPKFTLRSYQSARETCNFFLSELKRQFSTDRFILFYADSEFALSHKKYFALLSPDHGVAIKGAYLYRDADQDFRNVIAQADLSNCNVIYIAGQYQSLGRMVKQLRQYGYQGRIVGDGHMNSPSATQVMGCTKGVYAINVAPGNKNEAIASEFRERFGASMDDIATFAYNGMDMLFSHIEECGTFDAEKIMGAINGFKFEGISGMSEVKDFEILVQHKFIELQ